MDLARLAILLLPTILWAQPLRTLTTAAAVHALSVTEAKRQYPVRLRATVTYGEEGGRELFVQDGTGGVLIERNAERHADLSAVQSGNLVEITGVSSPGVFSPAVGNASIHMVGRGRLPRAVRAHFDKLVTPIKDADWIELEGVVRTGQVKGGKYYLNIGTPGGTFVAVLPATGVHQEDSLIDARVAIQGVLEVIANRRRQAIGMQMLVPDVRYLRIEEPGLADPYSLALLPAANLGQFQTMAAFNQRVHVQGTVMAVEPDHVLYISEGEVVLTVVPAASCQPRVGELVDFVGYRGALHSRPALVDAVCRARGAGPQMRPVRMRAEQAVAASRSSGTDQSGADGSRFDLALVEIEGILVDALPGKDCDTLTLASGVTSFTATLPVKGERPVLPALGSRLRLTGISQIELDAFRRPESLRILLRGPGDLVVVARPPWLNLRRAIWCLALLAGLFVATLIWVSVLRRQVVRRTRELRVANDALLQLSIHDPLTGVANRRKLDETLETELFRARRGGKPMSLAMVDIDYFKSFNDCCGHQKGDRCLSAVACALVSVVRRHTDLVARYGGEEFAVVLPGMAVTDALVIAERMRVAVEGLGIEHPARENQQLSISVGVATYCGDEDCGTAELVARADRALYQAKSQGRNRAISLDRAA